MREMRDEPLRRERERERDVRNKKERKRKAQAKKEKEEKSTTPSVPSRTAMPSAMCAHSSGATWPCRKPTTRDCSTVSGGGGGESRERSRDERKGVL